MFPVHHFVLYIRPFSFPPIQENPFVRNLGSFRFSIRCCISRRHLVKSEFSIDFHHNIVFYNRLRAARRMAKLASIVTLLGSTSLVASEFCFR